jgi:hypothetical protein
VHPNQVPTTDVAAAVLVQAKVDRARGINLRINRKRPLAALTWTLAPGLKIGVQVSNYKSQVTSTTCS